MNISSKTLARLLNVALLGFVATFAHVDGAAADARRFTVADDIGCAVFGDPYSAAAQAITLSPDGKLAAVGVSRGLLHENRVQGEVRIYDVEALRRFANREDNSPPPEPIWSFVKATAKESPTISELHWLADSNHVALLVKLEDTRRQLWLADVRNGSVEALTPAGQDVTGFHVVDRTHFVYAARTLGPSLEAMDPEKVSAFDATGQSLFGALMYSAREMERFATGRSVIWASRGGVVSPVRNRANGLPLVAFPAQIASLSMSPDGKKIALALPLENVPADWADKYRAPAGTSLRLLAGPQDLDRDVGIVPVSAYAVIDVDQGAVSFPTGGPTGRTLGWLALRHTTRRGIEWSADSSALLLPGTFIGDRSGAPPDLVVVRLTPNRVERLESLTDYHERVIEGATFADGRSDRVLVDYIVGDKPGGAHAQRSQTYSRNEAGEWKAAGEIETPAPPSNALLAVKQSLNDPPVLVITDSVTRKSRPVWDPNPSLAAVQLGAVSVFRWAHPSGKECVGGLYVPPDFSRDRRYPLVIQTHGFVADEFRPAGIYPSGFAAQALAANGIVVLQCMGAPDGTILGTADEIALRIQGYRAAIRQLTEDGIIDPERVGLIGFSRMCIDTMTALTTDRLDLRAASIIDGVNVGYLQYLVTQDSSGESAVHQRDAERIVGAAPYGPGLRRWLEQSPEFNLDKVTAPLQVVAPRGMTTVFMWEPYAMLRQMHKSVDLLVLNTSEHIHTNPGVRLAAQGGAVDWFRFWLKDEEDPDPKKAEQYARWRKLRELHEADLKAAGRVLQRN